MARHSVRRSAERQAPSAALLRRRHPHRPLPTTDRLAVIAKPRRVMVTTVRLRATGTRLWLPALWLRATGARLRVSTSVLLADRLALRLRCLDLLGEAPHQGLLSRLLRRDRGLDDSRRAGFDSRHRHRSCGPLTRTKGRARPAGITRCLDHGLGFGTGTEVGIIHSPGAATGARGHRGDHDTRDLARSELRHDGLYRGAWSNQPDRRIGQRLCRSYEPRDGSLLVNNEAVGP